MTAYLPASWAVVGALACALVGALVAGFALARYVPRPAAALLSWVLFVFGTAGVERLVCDEPAGVRMLALIVFALVAMKAVVTVAERSRGTAPLSFGRWIGFAALWPGMQPRLFAVPGKGPLRGASDLIRRGIVRLLFGALLLVVGRLAWTDLHSRLAASICLLAGLSFVLHFGLCNLLAGVWRAGGIPCESLFRAPLRSQSLAEFWARRWNLAFSEMTSIAVYRPLALRLGRGPALMAAFLLSGLLHEMAISVPVRAGFGLPLCYFALHGGLVLTERLLAEAGRPIGGPLGRAWCLFWLVAPLPLLFHRPFLAGVVWPIVGIPAEG